MSTITVPTAADVGAYSTEVANAAAVGKNYDARVAQKLIDVATAAKADIEALEGGSFGSSVIPVANLDTRAGIVHSVRGVVTANVASLSAFTVATHDGLTFVEGNRVLLAKQTTGAQNGIYVVGAVDAGAAPLTRAADWAAAAVLPAGSRILVNEGDTWKHSEWFASLVGAITVATSSPAFYPKQVKGTSAALDTGSISVSNTWILSDTTSNVQLTVKTPGGTRGHLSHGTLTPGAGNGSFTITTTDNADTSTVSYLIVN
jgi:hypothetical protein